MEKPRFNPTVPWARERLPVTEHGEDIVAALQRIKADVDSALSLAVSVLGQYVDKEVRPLESGKPPRTPTPLADRAIKREIEQTLADIAETELKTA